MKNFISINIIYLAHKSRLGQDDFGIMFDLKRGAINSYCTNKALPKIETIQRICKHYEILIDDFVNRDLSKEQLTYTFHTDSIGKSNQKAYGIRQGQLLYANEPDSNDPEYISPRYVARLEKTIINKSRKNKPIS
jgi:transcriptional regulator with XRE-family HTH domain